MSTKYIYTEVEADLGQWNDEELIEELEARGYQVDKEPEVISAEYYWKQGNRKEALFLLERQFPEFLGISKLIE